jgi:hypothetical protein
VIGAWATPTRSTLSGTTKTYGSSVDCNSWDGTTFQYGVLFDSSATDDVEIEVYAASSDDFDAQDIPVMTVRVNRVSSDEVFGVITIRDAEYVRASAVQTGSTDSHDVRIRSTRFRDKTI